jgi:arginine repressor
MPNSKKDIQTRIENLLKDNLSKSYSREEIIDLLSHELYKDKQQDVEKILGEIEVWSSMKDNQSSIYSSCKDGTVYFQWGDTP